MSEFIAEKGDLCAFHRGKLRMLRGGLDDTIGLLRMVVVGVALGRVGVKRFYVGIVWF